ncbi:hypothetical protein IGL98_000407 [Enterococcus sp. DIV0840]|uniref:AAA family ATPase n=1 Tax=unclassified Enterococcus TaxID=2608891 RepID=UPI0030D1509E
MNVELSYVIPELPKRKGRVIINANQKGGVGKTTASTTESSVASLPNEEFDYKCLFIDWDKQGNATSLFGKTYNVNFPKSIYRCIEDGDLKSGVVSLNENLDMIAGSGDMSNLGDLLEELYPRSTADYKRKRTFHFSKLLDQIRDEYDFIWIDVGPSTDIKVDNAMVCADYVIIIQETKTYSYEGSVDIIQEYLQTLVEDFGSDFKGEVIGLLPFLLQPKRNLHEKILKNTYETFGRKFVFSTTVTNNKRLEDYPEYGITVNDYHDRRVFGMFADIFTEIKERIAFTEVYGDVPDDYSYQNKYLDGNKLTRLSKELNLNEFTR